MTKRWHMKDSGTCALNKSGPCSSTVSREPPGAAFPGHRLLQWKGALPLWPIKGGCLFWWQSHGGLALAPALGS